MNPLQQIPSLGDLQQYNVNRPGQIEGIRASLYDFQTYANAGTTTTRHRNRRDTGTGAIQEPARRCGGKSRPRTAH